MLIWVADGLAAILEEPMTPESMDIFGWAKEEALIMVFLDWMLDLIWSTWAVDAFPRVVFIFMLT